MLCLSVVFMSKVSSIVWLTVSKALEKSRDTVTVCGVVVVAG